MGTAGVPPRRISSRQHHIQDDRSRKDISDHIAAQLPITDLANPPEGFPYENKEPQAEAGDQEPPEEPPTTTNTDDGNALRLIDTHGHKIRRVADMRRWHHWDEQRWVKDDEGRTVREHAREHARTLPEGSRDEQKFKYLSMSSAGLTACIRVAETDPRVSILAGDLDAHPELINSPSGVVNLRTGETQPHNPALLLSRITNHGANPETAHPQWDAFLTETFNGDQELISYMQKLFGLALLGMVTEHILVFLHGTGANGKGVLTLVLQGLLGDADHGGYAVSAPDGFLMSGRDGKHETEMARLRGTRLLVCSEQTSGKRFDEAKSNDSQAGMCSPAGSCEATSSTSHPATSPGCCPTTYPKSKKADPHSGDASDASRSCTWCQKTNATQRSTPSS